jgi:hypothetical protein
MENLVGPAALTPRPEDDYAVALIKSVTFLWDERDGVIVFGARRQRRRSNQILHRELRGDGRALFPELVLEFIVGTSVALKTLAAVIRGEEVSFPLLSDLFAPDDGREGFQRDARSDDEFEYEFGDLVEPDGAELLSEPVRLDEEDLPPSDHGPLQPRGAVLCPPLLESVIWRARISPRVMSK